MADYIRRILAKAQFTGNFQSEYPTALIHALLDDVPSEDVRPVVRGEWEHTEDFDEYGGGRYVEWTCSVCFCKAKGGWAVRDKHIDEPPAWNFCPNCGADMGNADD